VATFFPNVSDAYKSGLVTPEMVDEWIALVYGDDPEAAATKRAATIKDDGTIVQFQVVSIHRLAKEAAEAATIELVEAVAEPVARTDIPEELKADIPEMEASEALPDIAGAIKSRVGIISAVRKWGKPQDRIRDARTEGVKVRCPFHDHVDYRPSAWVNTEKNTWYCGKCSVGGDVIDFFVARRYGLKPVDFHRSSDFHTVVREMGEELGLSVRKSPVGGWEMVEEGVELPSPLVDHSEEEEVAPRSEDPLPSSPEAFEPITVSEEDVLKGIDIDSEDLDVREPTDLIIEWRDYAINPGSFLGEWMQHAERHFLWAPQEYFFFLGLQAIGMACGHDTQTYTDAPLNGNLMITLVGPSGGGKSTAVGEIKRMFDRISVVRFDPETGTGVKFIPNPGSAEALAVALRTDIEDPVDIVKKVEVPTTAWLYVDELADYASKASRRGGGNMKTILLTLFDFVKRSSAPERVIDEVSLGSGKRIVHDTHFSATFTTQTASMREMMSGADLISGFLGRIIPVFGNGRVKRRYGGEVTEPEYLFDVQYERMWRLRRDLSRKRVQFTPEAWDLINTSPLWERMAPDAVPDLMARAHLFTFKIAFLLAVNNGEHEIGPEYVDSAMKIVYNYIMPGFGGVKQAVKATEWSDLQNKMMAWCQRHYDRHGTWPIATDWANAKWTRYGDLKMIHESRDLLIKSGEMVIVKIATSGKPKQALVIPKGKWAEYAGWDSKIPVDEETMYPRKRK